MKTKVVTPELPPAKHADDFRLHCAALEWSLAEPIIIHSAEDIKSRGDWKDRVEPYRHQVENLMRFCRRLPVTLLADDVGLGKTISAGLIVSELMKRNRIAKILVICPKILIEQWVEELEAKFGLKAWGGTGAELRGCGGRTEPVIVTTYQSATGFLEDGHASGFDMLILDEAHKVRNLHGTQNAPKMASAIFQALESRTFKYVLMLTATPIQNRLWDIYSLVDCLAVARGHANPFGTPAQFVARFVADGKQIARRLRPEHAEEFRKIVNSYMFRTRRADAKLVFPDRNVVTYAVRATAEESTLQATLAQWITRFGALEQSSLLVALMSSPQALAGQLANMATKSKAAADLAAVVRPLVASVTRPAKAGQVFKIIEHVAKQSPDWRMVIFTTRRETQAVLGKILAAEGISHGFITGNDPAGNRRTIEGFRKEKPDIHVIVSTDAGAEGVNLQAANILVNYDLPWNPMIVEQRIGRVQRIGSKFKSVWVSNIVHHDSPEQRIVARLMEKLQVISHTVGDIEAVLEAADDTDGTTLEQQIREMVIKALHGQDPKMAADMAMKSIQDAKELLEKQQAEMDATLGGMDDADQVDIPMPKLAPAKPSMPLERFVLSALEQEGTRVRDDGSGLYTGRDANNDRVRFTFDPRVLEAHSRTGVFGGNTPQLYQPGKPAFERLIQRWVGRSAVHGEDTRCTIDDAPAVAGRWVGTIPGAAYVGCRITEEGGAVSGRVLCTARAANSIDSYEKILEVAIASPLDGWSVPVDSGAPVDPRRVFSQLDSLVHTSVAADPDIGQFRTFYQQRLDRELTKSEAGERREKLVNDLAPGVTAETAAIEFRIGGARFVEVIYRFGDSGEYRSRIAIENGAVVREPARHRCELTATSIPEDCLELCQVTGKRGLRHLMQRSDIGAGYALPSKCLTCAVTGKRILETEAETCCLTGKVASRSALVKSEVSGRYVAPERATVCEITRAAVADDELVQSSISQKWFRRDQAVLLADGVSGAHRGEAKRCEFSGVYVPPAESTVSAYSGKTLAKERVVRSALSGRECDPSELMRCAESGLTVLPDELVKCAVSSKWILKDLTAACPETHARASQSLFVECQASKAKVLPAGLTECCVTGKRVRKSLLTASAASSRLALASAMCRCQASGAMLMPDEVERSEISGKLVDKRLLQRCVVSGRIGLDGELVRSALSGSWMLPEHAITLTDGRRAGKHESARCEWTGRLLPADATAECQLCGVRLDKKLLNPSGEFAGLREVLDGKRKGIPLPDPGYLARTAPVVFKGVHGCDYVSSATHQAHILTGTKSFLGLNRRVFAVIAVGQMSGLRLVGKALIGKQASSGWTATETMAVG
jgi:superfamily II DNA or RNA helicase